MQACMLAYTCMHASVCFVCMHAYVHTCMCARCIHVCAHTHTCMHACTGLRTCQVILNVCVCVRARARACVRVCAHARILQGVSVFLEKFQLQSVFDKTISRSWKVADDPWRVQRERRCPAAVHACVRAHVRTPVQSWRRARACCCVSSRVWGGAWVVRV